MKLVRTQTLRKKILSLCILLAAIICLGCSISGYLQYRNSIYHMYSDFAYELAEITRSYVDGDRIDYYLETEQTDDAYDEMARKIRSLYDNANIGGIYICVPSPDGTTLANVYDVRIHTAQNPALYALGVVDPIGADAQVVAEVFQTGQRSSDYYIRQNSFGYNSSAVLPVFDSAGKPSALVAVDIPIPNIQENLNHFLLRTVGVTALIILIFVAFFQTILQYGVVQPMRLIAEEAENFTKSHNTISQKLQTIQTHDEIEQLAKSVLQMEYDINQYIDNLTSVTAEKERIGAELDVANHIQASMLPSIFPAFPERPELDIYASMLPAKEVGGDFYDFFLVDDDRLAMVMADVSGKGIPAALFMVIAKTLLKNVAQTGLSPKAVLEKVNNQLCMGNDAEMFVTVWLGILEISTGTLTCANAGHEYPVLKRAGGDYELIKDKHGFVLAGMEGSRYREYQLLLHPGDKLFLYTDGVAEATNVHNELYGTDRMLDILNRSKDDRCDVLLQSVKRDIDLFVGKAPQFDDITMLSLELRPHDGSGMKKLKISPTLEAIEQVSAFIEQELEQADIPMKTIAQMNIAVDEIFSNIARYSGATDATIGIRIENGCVTLRFADNGLPYDPTARPDPDTTLSIDEREIGGLGLLMVKKSMNTVEYEYRDGLNILTLTKQAT